MLGSGGLLLAPTVFEQLLHTEEDSLFVAHRLGSTILLDPYTSLGSLGNEQESSSPVFSSQPQLVLGEQSDKFYPETTLHNTKAQASASNTPVRRQISLGRFIFPGMYSLPSAEEAARNWSPSRRETSRARGHAAPY